MKRKKQSAAFALISVISVFFITLCAYGSGDDVPVLSSSAFEHKMRPDVPFDHDEHNENAGIDDCAVCHHVYEDGKLVEGESSEDMQCSECHSSSDTLNRDLMKAFHKSCKGCHEAQKAGPVMCGECHVRSR